MQSDRRGFSSARDELGAVRTGEAQDSLLQTVMAYLSGERQPTDGALSEEALLEALARLLDGPPPALVAFLSRRLADARVRARLVRQLPQNILVRISAALAPRGHRAILDTAEIIHSAWAAAAPGRASVLSRQALWSVVLDVLARSAGREEPSIERVTLAFFAHLATAARDGAGRGRDAPALGQTLLAHALRFARNAGRASVTEALSREQATLVAVFHRSGERAPARSAPRSPAKPSETKPAAQTTSESQPDGSPNNRRAPSTPGSPSPTRPRPRTKPTRGKTAFRLGGPDSADDLGGEAIFIDNAGIVLAGPFLPHLFAKLDMLVKREEAAEPPPAMPPGVPPPRPRTTERLRDPETASRAVHLLQYLVDGRTDAPEPTLVLPKVLCGVPIAAPIAKQIDLTPAEREACDRLLRSIIVNWRIIPNTSVAGLRETFLQREGKLVLDDDRFVLRVQRKTVDVLVDQIPWSIAILYHPWMPSPLHVTW